MGQLVFQATAGGQVALVGPNPSSNFSLNVPAVNGNLVTTGDTGTVTSTMLASSVYTAPGTIGSGTPNTGAFTSLSASTSITNSSLTAGRVVYTGTGGLESASANLTFNGTTLTVANDASISGLTVGRGVNGSGTYNSAFGVGALAGSNTGNENTAIGFNTLNVNTSGASNLAVGDFALSANTTGSNNTSIGSVSLANNTTGGSNTAIGRQALQLNTTASNNTAVGYQAGYANTTGYNQAALGYQALYSNTTGVQNTAVGQGALQNNTTANNNTAVGAASLLSNSTGASNAALGFQALYSNTTASNNTAVGYQAGYSNTTGAQNCVLGNGALYANITGSQNAVFGMNALNGGGSNSNNSAFGYASLNSLGNNANSNTGIGSNAGQYITSGVNNICIGSNSGLSSSPSGIISTQSNYACFGDNNITNAYIKVSWTVTSDARDKTEITPVSLGLDFVSKLNPVSYKFTDNRTDKNPTGDTQYGFLAQEILALEGNNPIIIDNKDENALKYKGESLVPVLVKAIQELKAEVDSLKQQLGK